MVTIRYIYNHYEVFDGTGRFLFSADDPGEVKRELLVLGLTA